jgi:hypothetical protein
MNELVGVTEIEDPEHSPRDLKLSMIKNEALPPLNLSPRSPRKRTGSKLDSKSPVKEKNSRLSLNKSTEKFPEELLDSPGSVEEIKPQLPRFFLKFFNTSKNLFCVEN